MKQVVKFFTWEQILEYTSQNCYIIGLPLYQGEVFKRLLYNNIPYPDYLISNYGRLYSTKFNRLMKTQLSIDDYDITTICAYGYRNKHISIHRAVNCTFNPIQNVYYMTTDHIDGNHHNNHISNFRWLTSGENSSEGHRMGYSNHGDKNPNSIFTEAEVHEICKCFEQQMSYDEILEKIGKPIDNIKHAKQSLHDILYGNYYKYISKDYNFKIYDMKKYLYKDKMDDACRLLSEGVSKDDICKILEIPDKDIKNFKGTLSLIKQGRSFRDIAVRYGIVDESKSIYTMNQVEDICKYIVEGKDNRDICISLGINFDNEDAYNKMMYAREINRIRNKVIYTYISDKYF